MRQINILFIWGEATFQIHWILINVSQSKKNSFSEATPIKHQQKINAPVYYRPMLCVCGGERMRCVREG